MDLGELSFRNYKVMKYMWALLFWALASSSCLASESSDQETLAGVYFLEGVMEMGSTLKLEKNGEFKAHVAYGAADGFAQGTWKRNRDKVHLSPSEMSGLGELFKGWTLLEIDGACLRIAPKEEGGCYRREVKLPYDSWRLGLFAPNYMEVWIETADAVDVRDRVFRRAMSGLAAINTPKNLKGNPRGWPQRPGAGAGKQVLGADLPRVIYVRWQSLVEPQIYEAYIIIPEVTRQAMLKGEKAFCEADAKWITDYRKMLSVGLAPGGVAKVWLMGPCLSAIDVTRVQGTVVKKGPYGGKASGYYRPPNKASRAYIEKHGIPYDSW